MSSVSVNGAFALFFANLISKLFGAVYRLPLSNLLGAEGIGLYQMAFPIYSFLLTLITGGISITLTRQIARLRANKDEYAINKQFSLGKNVSLWAGVFCCIFLIAMAYPFSRLQGNDNAILGYFAIAIGFVFASVLGAYRGFYQGFGNMKPTAMSQVIEQVSKLFFGLLFAGLLIKHGIIFGVFGALLGVAVSEFFAFCYFCKINKRHIKKHKSELSKRDYWQFLKQVAPVSVSYMLLPLSSLIDSFLVINLLTGSGFLTGVSTSLYGIETGMILPLINLPNVLIGALALACIPEISYKLGAGINPKEQIEKLFKTVLIFILPCAVGMFLLAEPILAFVYPTLDASLLSVAVNLLKFSVFEMFLLCFITVSNSLLQAFAKSKVSACSLAFGIFVKVILTAIFMLNKSLNICGLVLASVFGYFVACLINILAIKRQIGFRLKFIEIFAPIFSCVVMSAGILIWLGLFNGELGAVKLFTCVILSVIVYFACLICFRQFGMQDVKKILQIKGN